MGTPMKNMNKTMRPLLFFLCFLLLPVSAYCLARGDRLIPFSATDMDGNSVELEKIIGNQPVMLVFWASWCPNCTREVPKINSYVESLGKKGMKFIGINIGYNDSPARARAFMEKTKMTYPNIFDKDRTITGQYKIFGVPTIIIADKSGKVVHNSPALPDDLEKNSAVLFR